MPLEQEIATLSLTDQQRVALLAALESRGWLWRDAFIYAPQGTLWLLGADPWGGDLAEFHERMCGRLQRNVQAAAEYDNPQDYRNLVDDTSSLVEALAALIAYCADDCPYASTGNPQK